jgi:hypothetical protein
MANRADTFNRADTSVALGTPSDSGSAWSELSGTWGIESNQARKVTAADGQHIAVLESNAADVEVQCTFPVLNSTADAGLIVRCVDSSNYLLIAIRGAGGTRLELYTRIAGAETLIAAGDGTNVTAGCVVKVSANGSTINVYVDGVLALGPQTVASLTTATQHGIRAYLGASGSSTGTAGAVRHDDFSITDLAGGGGGGGGNSKNLLLLGVG